MCESVQFVEAVRFALAINDNQITIERAEISNQLCLMLELCSLSSKTFHSACKNGWCSAQRHFIHTINQLANNEIRVVVLKNARSVFVVGSITITKSFSIFGLQIVPILRKSI